MKRKLLSLLLSFAMVVTMMPALTFTSYAADNTMNDITLDNVAFKVAKNATAGLDGDVDIVFAKSGTEYKGTLYLPGSAETSRLMLSWDNGVVVSTGDITCESGETVIPGKGASTTYSVTVGNDTADFTVKTVQGSSGVHGLFLNIDEERGTIAAMNADPDHETTCYGTASFGTVNDSVYISIKGRGNSTWRVSKKPYNITFYKGTDYANKKKVELIEGVKSKKWSILANAMDGSLMRNKVGNDLAVGLGIGLESSYIDVWMNGKYLGNYLLTPKNDYQAPNDGYMVEIDNFTDVDQFTLQGSLKFTVKEMADDMTVDQVKASVSEAWSALMQSDSDEYLEYFDLDSWAKMYLLHEFYKDHDIQAGSFFFTKENMDAGSKLVAGPIWDLDLTQGRTTQTYINVDHSAERTGGGWYIDGINTSPTQFLQLFGKHESFMKRVYEIYNEYKSSFDAVIGNIDDQKTLLADSAAMNFMAASFSGTMHNVAKDNTTYGEGDYAVTYSKTDTWEDYVANYREYATKRLHFLTDNLAVSAPANGTINGNTSYDVLDPLSLTAGTEAKQYQWQFSTDGGKTWVDIDGATNKICTAKVLLTMQGSKIRCLAKNVGEVVNTSRVAKVAPAAVTVLEPIEITVNTGGHIHNCEATVINPTCTRSGYTVNLCECGYAEGGHYDVTVALGHNFKDGTCTRCGAQDPEHNAQNGSLISGLAVVGITAAAVAAVTTVGVLVNEANRAKREETKQEAAKLLEEARVTAKQAIDEAYGDSTDPIVGGYFDQGYEAIAQAITPDEVLEATVKYVGLIGEAQAVVGTKLVQNKLSATKNGKIIVSYEAADIEGVVGYVIHRATDKKFTKNVKTYNTKKTTLTNAKNLKKGTRYYYQVYAKVQLSDGNIVNTSLSNIRYTKCKKTR